SSFVSASSDFRRLDSSDLPNKSRKAPRRKAGMGFGSVAGAIIAVQDDATHRRAAILANPHLPRLAHVARGGTDGKGLAATRAKPPCFHFGQRSLCCGHGIPGDSTRRRRIGAAGEGAL